VISPFKITLRFDFSVEMTNAAFLLGGWDGAQSAPSHPPLNTTLIACHIERSEISPTIL